MSRNSASLLAWPLTIVNLPSTHLLTSSPTSNGLIVEHNVPAPTKSAHSQRRRPRPDLDTFYSSLSLVDTSAVQNANATPIPADVAASYRLLSEGMQAMMRDNPDQALTERLTEFLMQRAEMPPERIDGVPDEFIDGTRDLRGQAGGGDELKIHAGQGSNGCRRRG